MLLRSTLFPADFAHYFNITPDLYSIHVIPMTEHTLSQLTRTAQTVEINGEPFEYFQL